MQRMVAAVDGSDHAYKAVEFAIDLAQKYGARLTAVHVVSDRPLSDGERRLVENEHLDNVVESLDIGGLMESKGDPRLFARAFLTKIGETGIRVRRALGERYLDQVRHIAKRKGFEDLDAVIEEGDPADAVLRVAEAQNADLIVTGSRGLGDIQGALLGSVSHKVAHRADCTCITVK